MTASENITRAEAKERSTLVAVQSYDVVLDVTSDGPTFASRTTVAFTCHEPGATTWIDLIAPTVHSGDAERRGTRRRDRRGRRTHRPSRPRGRATSVEVVADCAFMNTGEGLHRFVDPVDKETYLYSQFESADSRRMYASFEQPDLKATFQLHGHRPVALEGRQQLAHARAGQPRRRHRDVGLRARRRACPPTSPPSWPARTTASPTATPVSTAPTRSACSAAQSLAEYLDADDIFTITKQGFAYFEAQFGVGLPVRQVRPVVRAGVQRRRHGERGLRHAPRGLRLPVARHRRRLRAALEHDPPRARAHVVRRSGHHDVVGRPVAERVLRGVGRRTGPTPTPPATPTRGRRSRTCARPGPTARTSCRRRTRSPPTWSTSTPCA